MSVFDRLNLWWQERTGEDAVLFDYDSKAWLVSLAIHLVFIVAMGLLARQVPILDDWLLTLADLDEQMAEEPEELAPIPLSDDPMPEIGIASAGIVEEAAPPVSHLSPDVFNALEATDVLLDSSWTETMAELSSDDLEALSEDIAGMPNAIVKTRGDVGSVDRITTEILTQLEQNDLLVVWLMDASESLRLRRKQVIQRFNRVYDELDVFADDRGDALLTSVAAFGKETLMMTSKPTADRREIQDAVREIKVDESGIENVFSAIKSTALAYRKFSRTDRKIIIIVFTDEMGNDLPLLDEAAALLKRHRISVYVMGPLAPFGSEQVFVKWTDKERRDVFYLPVDRGPESAQIEHARLAIWQDGPGTTLLSSGFGPYGLTRITQENEGLYLLYDDGNIPGPSFDVRMLSAYRPDYLVPAEYAKLAAKSPLRMAVLQTAQAANMRLIEPLPTRFLAAGIQFEIRNVRKTLGTTIDVLNRGLNELSRVEKTRKKEKSRRWHAHYDLLMGRILANGVRCQHYAQLLEQMYVNPRAPQDGTKNAWKLVSRKLGDGENTTPAAADSAPDEQEKVADLARQYLERVINKYPNTPWAAIAKSELDFPFSFRWQEAFMIPPVGVPLPWDKVPWAQLTEAQKEAKGNFERKRNRRRKRIQEQAKQKIAKRPPPKL